VKDRLPELKLPETENAWAHRNRIISFFLREKFQDRKTPVKVLEAGCGRWWPLDLGALPVELTGIDTDKDALDARVRDIGDLHRVIAADIRDVKFEPEEFDLIYSCEVLEHVKGAQEVIEKLFGWLKRDGAAVLVFPDRNTVFGLATRLTPHWLHVAYHRYVLREASAGQPGFGPYPTYYDGVISRRGMHDFCATHHYSIALEYGRPPARTDWPLWFWAIYQVAAPVISNLSCGVIASSHIGLVYILEKNQLPALRADHEST